MSAWNFTTRTLLLGALCGLTATQSHADPAPPFTLAAALRRALAAEPRFQVTRLALPIANASLEREAAAWDLFFSGNAEYRDIRTVASTGLDGARVSKRDQRTLRVGVTKPLSSGGEVSLQATDDRLLTNSSFALLNPAYRAGVQVGYKQPLAQGGGRDANRRALSRAELEIRRAELNLQQAVLDLVARTERAYWTLASSREQFEVAESSLAEAENLLATTRTRVEAGAEARVAVIEAEAAVASRRVTRLDARRNLVSAQVGLLAVTEPPPKPGARPPPLASRPGSTRTGAPDSESLVAEALRSHPVYLQALSDLRAEEIEVAFAKDATLPRIDLTATLQTNGLGSSRSNSVDQSASLDFPSYVVGIAWQIPLGRRAAKAELRRRRLQLETQVRQLKATELELESSVESARRRLEVDLQAQQVVKAQVVAASAKLVAERERYNEGALAADDLLRFQQELSSAQAREASARARASLSEMDLWAAVGSLPTRRGIQLDATGLLTKSP